MEITIPRSRVWVLNVNPGQVATEFADSLMAVALADVREGWGFFAGKYEVRSGANVAHARNILAAQFLDTTDGDWALFIDSDMVLPEDTIARMLAAATQADTKIVGALCVAVDKDGPRPTIFQHAAHAVTQQVLDYPDDTLLQVAATGTACLLIHRSVLEAMRAAAPDNPAFCWFQETVTKGRWVGEDIEFCLRAGQLGHTVYVDTTLAVGHAKWGRVWWPDDIRNAALLPKRPVVAVIPTRGTGGMVSDLVDQLVAQGEADEIIVLNNGEVPSDLAATVLAADPEAGIHTWWNQGAEHAIDRHGHRVHVAFLNDDLRIGDGFLGALSRALDADSDLVAVSGNYDGRSAARAALGGPHEPVQEVTGICAGRYDGTGGLAGFAFMTLGTLFTSGYRFPEECKWWYGDNDLVQTIAAGGGKTGIAIRAEVEHLDGGGRTAVDWSSPEYAAQLAADGEKYRARWTPRPADSWDPLALAAAASA